MNVNITRNDTTLLSFLNIEIVGERRTTECAVDSNPAQGQLFFSMSGQT